MRLRGRPISARNQKRFSEILRQQLGEGEEFCKNFLRQKTCVVEGEERERALDDVFGI